LNDTSCERTLTTETKPKNRNRERFHNIAFTASREPQFTDAELRVLLYLASLLTAPEGCQPSHATIMNHTGIRSSNTLQKALLGLETIGVITREPGKFTIAKTKSGASTKYTIYDPAHWVFEGRQERTAAGADWIKKKRAADTRYYTQQVTKGRKQRIAAKSA
jgi:hypothetical protein